MPDPAPVVDPDPNHAPVPDPAPPPEDPADVKPVGVIHGPSRVAPSNSNPE